MRENEWIQSFKQNFFGACFNLSFSAVLPTAFILLIIGIIWFIVIIPTSYLFIKWFDDGMLIINDQLNFEDIDTSAGPWGVFSDIFTFEFGDLGIYYLMLAIGWLFITYLFFLGYTYQVVIKIFLTKIKGEALHLFDILLKSLNGRTIKTAVLMGLISIVAYIPVLLIQSIAPYSFSLSLIANLFYYILVIKLITSPVVYIIDNGQSIARSILYSWKNVSWSSALKVFIFSFGFIMFLVVFYIFATLIFTITSVAFNRLAIPIFLFFVLLFVFLFTLILSAQFGLYYRYLPLVEEVEEPEILDSEIEDLQDDDFYFPGYDDEGDK